MKLTGSTAEPLLPRVSILDMTSDCQDSNFETCIWDAVLSDSYHHPLDVFLVQVISLYVHTGGPKPRSFIHLYWQRNRIE